MVIMTPFDPTNPIPSENNKYLKDVSNKYALGLITWSQYVDQIQNFVNSGYFSFSGNQTDNTSQQVPTWIKDQSRWYSTEQISSQSYNLSLQWMYENGWLNNP